MCIAARSILAAVRQLYIGVLLLLLLPTDVVAQFCGVTTSAAWSTRCAGATGSGDVYVAAFLDSAHDPNKDLHFHRTVALINNHTDGFYDNVLTDTTLVGNVFSSNCDSVLGAQLFWDAWRDWGRPLHGVIGARCSGASMAIAQIAGLDQVPQVSPSSTSASLSNKRAYPYFSRTVAPDNENGLVGAMVQMLASFGWRHVSVIQTDASYANTLAVEFKKAWCTNDDRSIGYSHTLKTASLVDGVLDVGLVHAALDGVPFDDPSVNSRVVVLVAHSHHAFQLLEQCADSAYASAFSDVVFIHSLPPNDYTPTGFGSDKPAWMPSIPGYLGIVPLASTSATHRLYKTKFGEWEQSQGITSSVRLPAYAAETVDAVVALAMALDSLPHEQRANGSAVLQNLRQLNFEGTSGDVSFNDHGDRANPLYTVVNLGAGSEWSIVGSVGTRDGTAEIAGTDICWPEIGCGHVEAPLDRYPPVKANISVGLLFAGNAPEDRQSIDERVREAGAQLAITHVNANDGILPDVRLVPTDVDLSLIRIARNSDQKLRAGEAVHMLLTQQNAVVAVGATWSSDVVALAPSLNIPLLSPSASAARLSNVSEFPLFGRLCLPDSRQAQALADVVKNFEWEHVAMVHCDDVYCQGLAADTRNQLGLLGIDLAWERQISIGDDDEEIKATTTHIKAKLHDCNEVETGDQYAILLIHHNAEPLLHAVSEMGIEVTWLAAEAIGSKPPGDYTAASNIFSLRPGGHDITFEMYQAFASAMPDAITNAFALMAYDAVYTLAWSMHNVQKAGGSIFNSSAIVEAAHQVKFDGASGKVAFDRNLDRLGNYDLVKPRAGQFVNVGNWEGSTRIVRTSEQLTFAVQESCDSFAQTLVLSICIIGGIVLFVGYVSVVVRRRRRSRNGHYTCFISHSKNDAGAEAQRLHTTFNREVLRRGCCGLLPTDRGSIFIDTVSLTEISTDTLVRAVRSSKVFVLLLTPEVLTRAWCLLEIYTALEAEVPIVPIRIERQNESYSYSVAARFLHNLVDCANDRDKVQMQKWFGKAGARSDIPSWNESVKPKTGLTIRAVQSLLNTKLPGLKAEVFNPNAHPDIIEAQLNVIVQRVEKALADHLNVELAHEDQNKYVEQHQREEEQELAVEAQHLTQLTQQLSSELTRSDTIELRSKVASASSLKLIEQAVPYMERSHGQIAQVKSLVTAFFDWLASAPLPSQVISEVVAETAKQAVTTDRTLDPASP